MGNVRIQAILDRLNTRSLGMVGIVTDTASGLRSSGVSCPPARKLDPDELEQLVDGGHATRLIDNVQIECEDARPLSALWLGNDFEGRLEKYSPVKLPPFPEQSCFTIDSGRFWVAPTEQVWKVIDSWIFQAFRHVIQSRNRDLAVLMNWAMPAREETRASLWLTALNEGDRNQNLAWWVRLEMDRGQKSVTSEQLVKRLKRLIDDSTADAKKVIGFCAKAKGGDKEIAEKTAGTRKVKVASFGSWLKVRAKNSGEAPTRLTLQKNGQQMIDKYGALPFCLDVLGDLKFSEPNRTLIIEGIRHKTVLESIRCLVGSDRFVLAYVERPESLRRKMLSEEENLSPGEIDQVLHDRTENEIDDVMKGADIELRAVEGLEAAERILNDRVPVLT